MAEQAKKKMESLLSEKHTLIRRVGELEDRVVRSESAASRFMGKGRSTLKETCTCEQEAKEIFQRTEAAMTETIAGSVGRAPLCSNSLAVSGGRLSGGG